MSTVRCRKCGSLVGSDKKSCHICGAKISHTTMLVKALAVFFACVLLVTCYAGLTGNRPSGPATTKPLSTESRASTALKDAPIRDDALSTYNKSNNPKLYKQWGADGLKRIEDAQRKAAEIVASSGRCDAVSIVGLAVDRSKPPKAPVNFVECENGLKFYLGLDDLDKAPKAESELAMNENTAIEICQSLVKSSAKFPSSVDFSSAGVGSDTNKTSGLVTVVAAFEAKNGVGNLVPQQAFCAFPVIGEPTIKISDR